MPDDSKKNPNKKNKNDAKEQRRPRSPRRHSRNQANQGAEKKDKSDVKPEKVCEKPLPQEPGPEFYKNLKRETEEILKISEEAHAKYAKKEIHSNWKKYELPIICYEDIEEQENIGADYEQLIQTPMATGGHFQFKHERNWDTVITPSEYDNFFEIDLQNLPVALMSIPFYERNIIDTKVFTPGDISNMKNRANKFKQKYDESNHTIYTNVKVDLQSGNMDANSEKFLNTIKSILVEYKAEEVKEPVNVESQDLKSADASINFEFDELKCSKNISLSNEQLCTQELKYKQDIAPSEVCINNKENVHMSLNTSEEILEKPSALLNTIKFEHDPEITKDDKKLDIVSEKQNFAESKFIQKVENKVSTKGIEEKVQDASKPTPIIQSSEDLEKWLDDFLDG